jgi:hypothetical protein
VKKFWYRFLDWAAGKLDRVAAEALDKSRVQDIPQGEVIIFRTFMIATPDRPEDPIRREIDALIGRQEAKSYPRGS